MSAVRIIFSVIVGVVLVVLVYIFFVSTHEYQPPVLSIAPAEGVAPLAVTFIYSENVASGGPRLLDFGDGTKDGTGGGSPGLGHTYFHTYKTPGTYQITFSREDTADGPSVEQLFSGTVVVTQS